jgi:release factor glutamine methyltransferase
MPTIGELIKEGSKRLREAGVPVERRTASLLLAEILGRDRTYLLAHDRDEVASEVPTIYRSAIERRASGEPLQYITGHQEFYGRDFLVTPAVLIPRPETELIVETTLRLAANSHTPRILDICTGSGCIAVTLAAELPQSRVFALDISLEALLVARLNAERNSVREWVNFFAGDLCTALSDSLKFDYCVANPPYVAPEERETLAREVREHEPELALFAPEGGLGIIRRLVTECATITNPGGYLLCEIGYGQEQDALAMIDPKLWEPRETIKDLQGIPRTLVIKKRSTTPA